MIRIIERIFILDGKETKDSELYRKIRRMCGKKFADSLVMERVFPP